MIDRRAIVASVGIWAASATAGGNAAAAEASSIDWARGPTPDVQPLGLRWAFSVSVFFASRVVVNAPIARGYTAAGGGEIWGPRLQGRVLPNSGADYPLIQADGRKNVFSTHYMLEASDGELIYIRNHGTLRRFRSQPLAGTAPEPLSGRPGPQDPAWVRMRFGPTFEAPLGRHDWLNRTVCVCHAQRYATPDHTIFTYYELV